MKDQRLDVYILDVIMSEGIQYVINNYILLRNNYYINKYGG
jgi:hypothetical protein